MAWIVPKTTWGSPDVPSPSDFNRIEGNTLDNHDSIIAGLAQEVTDRNAAIASGISSALASMFDTAAFTPTFTNSNNSWNLNSVSARYFKVDDMVHVSGHMSLSVNTTYANTKFYCNPPVSSSVVLTSCTGILTAGTSTYHSSGIIYGFNNKVYFEIPYPSTSSIDCFYEYTYQII